MEETIKRSKRQIFKFLLSILTGNLGSSILTFIIGLLILKNTDSAITFGISQIIGPLVALVLLPFTGSIIDKFDKKKVLIAAQFLSIASLTIYSIIIYFQGFDHLIYTYLLLILLKISDQFLTTGFTAAIREIVLEEHIQKVKSLQQVITAFILILTPILGALIVNLMPLFLFVWIEVIVELIAVFCIIWINFRFITPNDTEESHIENIFVMFKEGLKFIRKSRNLIFTLFFAMLVNFLFGAISVGLPFIQINVLHFSNSVYGMTEAIFPIGLILSGFLLSAVKEVKFPLFCSWFSINFLGVFFVVLGVLLSLQLTYTYTILIIGAFNFLLGVTLTYTNVPMLTWVTKETPANLQGRVFNLLNTGSQLLVPLGILVFSVLFDHYSSSIIFIITGICILLVTLIYPIIFKINLKNNQLVD